MDGISHAGLSLDRIGKSFAGAAALRDLSFAVRPHEILALTGPSGAGKSTACRIVAGLERPEAGSVFIANQNVTALPPQRREVSMMFESFALFPMMDVAANVAFSLRAPIRAAQYDEAGIRARVDGVLELMEMSSFRNRLPHELSGGQKQRVALCRALAQESSVYLLDEPISHLDAKLRHMLRSTLRRRLTDAPVSTVWCTPDSMEALAMGDRVAVMIDGRLQQLDVPGKIFNRPANIQVARLVGDPPMNLLEGALAQNGDAVEFRHEALSILLPDELRARITAGPHGPGVVLGVKASAIKVDPAGTGDGVAATVHTVEPFGKYSILSARLGSDIVKAKLSGAIRAKPGDRVSITISESEVIMFDAATGKAV